MNAVDYTYCTKNKNKIGDEEWTMRYGVCIETVLREPKNFSSPRNVLESFPLSFLCSETVILQEAHSQMYSRQENHLLSY